MPVPPLLASVVSDLFVSNLLVFALLGVLIMLLFGNHLGLHDYRYHLNHSSRRRGDRGERVPGLLSRLGGMIP